VTRARPGPPPASATAIASVTVVGIGADGWAGLPDGSRTPLLDAQVLIGASHQLDLLPPECRGERITWPSPLRPAVPGLLAAHAGRRIAVLASGDPMFYGIGRAVPFLAGAGSGFTDESWPHPSSQTGPVPTVGATGSVCGDLVELHKAGVPRQAFAATWLSRGKLPLPVGTSTTFGLARMGRATFKLGQWC